MTKLVLPYRTAQIDPCAGARNARIHCIHVDVTRGARQSCGSEAKPPGRAGYIGIFYSLTGPGRNPKNFES